MPELLRLEDIGTAIGVLLFCCAAIVTLWGAWKVVREIGKPKAERLEKLEEIDIRSERNGERIDEITDAIKLLLRSELCVMDHISTGNHVDQIKKTSNCIRDYIWETWGEEPYEQKKR